MKIYTTMKRPILLYEAKTWTVGKKEEKILEATEMRMLRRIKGVTERQSVAITSGKCSDNNIDKVRETRLRWYGHVMRMNEENPTKKTVNKEVEGRRTRGRPRKRWRDNIPEDMQALSLVAEDTRNRLF